MGIIIESDETTKTGLKIDSKYINIWSVRYVLQNKKLYYRTAEWVSRDTYSQKLEPLNVSDEFEINLEDLKNDILASIYNDLKKQENIINNNPIDIYDII